jgi:hypothetical protein
MGKDDGVEISIGGFDKGNLPHMLFAHMLTAQYKVLLMPGYSCGSSTSRKRSKICFKDHGKTQERMDW